MVMRCVSWQRQNDITHTHTRVENGDARADPGHAKGITSLIYFGMPECPQNSWRKWIGTGCFGFPCKNCCACDLKPDKKMKTEAMQLVNKQFSHSWQTTKQMFALRSYRFISGENKSQWSWISSNPLCRETTAPPALNFTGIWSKLIRDRWSSCAICILLKRGSKKGLCAS